MSKVKLYQVVADLNIICRTSYTRITVLM